MAQYLCWHTFKLSVDGKGDLKLPPPETVEAYPPVSDQDELEVKIKVTGKTNGYFRSASRTPNTYHMVLQGYLATTTILTAQFKPFNRRVGLGRAR